MIALSSTPQPTHYIDHFTRLPLTNLPSVKSNDLQSLHNPTRALCCTPYKTHINSCMFRHWSAILRKTLQQIYISQHTNVGSAPPSRNDWNLKMLKNIKLITTYYSITKFLLKYVTFSRHCFQFLVVFACVQDVHKQRPFSIWSENMLQNSALDNWMCIYVCIYIWILFNEN